MNDALISAQQLRGDLRAQAEREADLAVREARAEADRIIGDARREASEISESVRRMQISRARYLRSFRAFVERQLEEIHLEEERGDGPPRPAEPQTAHTPPGDGGI